MNKSTQTEPVPKHDNTDKTQDGHTTDYDEQETEPNTQKQFSIPCVHHQS